MNRLLAQRVKAPCGCTAWRSRRRQRSPWREASSRACKVGLDAPVLDRGFERRGLGQGGQGAAGDQVDGFGLLAHACASQAHDLRYEWRAAGFGFEATHHDGAGHRLTFIEVGPAQGARIGHIRLHRRLGTWLIAFDRHLEVAAMFHNDRAGGRGLRVPRVEADEPAGQIGPLEQRAGGRDLVGLGRDHFASQKNTGWAR